MIEKKKDSLVSLSLTPLVSPLSSLVPVSRLQSLVSPQTIEQTIVADSVTFFPPPQVPPIEREAHSDKNLTKKESRTERARLPLSVCDR